MYQNEIHAELNPINDDFLPACSLGFGANVNFALLQKLSQQHNGFARKIYEDTDAALQLEGFFNEIASPVLSDVSLTYLDDKVNGTSLTKTQYNTYFNGSELIVAGKLREGIRFDRLDAHITANSIEGPLVFDMGINIADVENKVKLQTQGTRQKNLQRMWAYLTIKEILKKSLEAESQEEKDALKAKALQLSLKV